MSLRAELCRQYPELAQHLSLLADFHAELQDVHWSELFARLEAAPSAPVALGGRVVVLSAPELRFDSPEIEAAFWSVITGHGSRRQFVEIAAPDGMVAVIE